MSDAYSCSSSRRSATAVATRSEEHTSELQSQSNLVCRLLLGKKKHTSELQSQSNLVCRLLLEKKKKNCEIQKQVNLGCYLLLVQPVLVPRCSGVQLFDRCRRP